MKKITFGTPDEFVPSKFCDKFNYVETDIKYPVSNIKYTQTKAGALIEFPIEDGAPIYGFGLQLKNFNQRGYRLRLAVNSDPIANTGDSHAPVPFFVTTKGYGMYFDTVRYMDVQCGRRQKEALLSKITENTESEVDEGVVDTTEELYKLKAASTEFMSILIPASQGIDIYIIEGDTITDIVKQYNMLAGGGPDVPEWALGTLYRCYTGWDSKKITEVAEYFREKDIPVDSIGLEPGWQRHKYPCDYVWNEGAFGDHDDFIKHMVGDLGYHLSLWQHAYIHPDAPLFKPLFKYAGSNVTMGGIVPDFSIPECSDKFAEYMKNVLVDHGIDCFKMDECDSGDYVGCWGFPLMTQFPSGMDGEQYHSLMGVLYCKTILKALGGKKTLGEVRSLGALSTSYPFVLYSDLYDHRDFVRGVVNSGFSGILWTPEFRVAWSKKECIRRIQSVVFSAKCQINAWNYPRIPWEQLDCEEEVKELLNIRRSLVPMLKKAYDEYRDTGKPPVRALVMDYTDDVNTYGVDDEYLFCDDLLVAPIIGWDGENPDERDVYLPESDKWVDYFTGEPVESGKIHVKTEGIPVYRRVSK